MDLSSQLSCTTVVLVVYALACDVLVAAASPYVRADRISTQEMVAAVSVPLDGTSEAKGRECPLRITDVRIEDAPPEEEEPSAVLKFHASNVSSRKLGDLVLAISIVEQPKRDLGGPRPHVLAGPFTIRSKVVLEPGYTADFEMLLRNLSRDCRCAVKVQVASVRFLPSKEP